MNLIGPMSKTASQSFLFIASAVLCASPLMAQKVSTDYDHKADFSKYHTFSITHLKIGSDSLVEQRLKDDLTSALTAHGLQQVPQGGDIDVTAVGSRKDKKEYNTFYNGLGGDGYGWGYGGFGWGDGFGGGFGDSGTATTSVDNVPVGTLVVDLYSGSDHKLLFRGVATDGLSSNESKDTKKLEKAVDDMFKKYPPKTS